jgi:SagB-type dehydrogenase family enzyme
VLENYLTGRQVAASPLVAQLLDQASDPVDLERLCSRFQKLGVKSGAVRLLVSEDVLLREGSPLDLKDYAVSAWPWGHDARYFHFGTRRVDYQFDFTAVRAALARKARTNPPPSPFKTYRGSVRKLPGSFDGRVFSRWPSNLWRTLQSRRTTRNFQRKSIDELTLGELLLWTSGMTHFIDDSMIDRRILKTSPSGGARHPLETYILVQGVKGVDPGAYHYSVERHALVSLGKKPSRRLIVRLFSGQWWVADAPVVLLFTAVLSRSMWKYDHSRAYRVILLDAGHLGQTLHLVGTALGLGVFTSAALQDEEIEHFLGLDETKEVVIYGGAVGVRDASSVISKLRVRNPRNLVK